MTYINQLKERAEQVGSIVSMGMDPVMDRIPIEGKPKEAIRKFYLSILDKIKEENEWPALVKPNIAFYEQYGAGGLEALRELIQAYQGEGIPVLLDAKRGDIGKTSRAYGKAVFEQLGVDALTVAPYMGFDSVGPFIERCKEGKGVYILCRTSNDGAKDLQALKAGGKSIFMRATELIANKWHKEGVGAVVGATSPEELKMVSKYFVESGKKIPMLIPGVGAQGGTAEEVVSALKETNNPLWLHRINSSSGINYAYEDEDTNDYAEAAVRAIRELNQEIGFNK